MNDPLLDCKSYLGRASVLTGELVGVCVIGVDVSFEIELGVRLIVAQATSQSNVFHPHT